MSVMGIFRQLDVFAAGMFRRWFASQDFVSDVTFFWMGLREYSSQQMEGIAMRMETDYSQSTKAMLSELAGLSCDPELSFRPDPTFSAKFRNPDEIAEAESYGVEATIRPVASASATWAHASWRRSSKD